MAAAALVKFRQKSFSTAKDLHAFVVANDSPVNTITAIVFDALNAQFIVFYMIA